MFSELKDNVVDLDYIKIDTKILKYIPKDIALKYGIIPIGIEKEQLELVTYNIINYDILEELKFISGMNIKIYRGDKTKIEYLINKYYFEGEIIKAYKALKSMNIKYKTGLDSFEKMNSAINNAPSVKITNYIINQAILNKASDIHIEPFENNIIIRFRVDGVLYKFKEMPLSIYHLICTRIKIMAQMDTTEKRIPQDGKIQYFYNNEVYNLRISSIPTLYDEKIVIRVLYKNKGYMSLEQLGFSDMDIKNIKNIINYSHGLLLIAGPTGSGKTTTLYSILNEINKKDKNIITIEDPVECCIKGINQINVNCKTGLSFVSGLRSVLRQDPDVIMIGEIRDEETAQIAVRAAITGHLVLSTIHTNDAASSIVRLMDMGVPKYLLADSIIAVIAQRLVRKICAYCKEEHNEDNINKTFYKGRGCIKCNGRGYNGRVAVYELMNIDNKHREIISNNFSLDKLRKYSLEKGMVPIKDRCFKIATEGITSYDEFKKLQLNYRLD